jgi:hypothetical protein
MGLGLVIGIAAVVAIVIPLLGSFTSKVHEVPSRFSVHLKHANYLVYQRTGTSSTFGSPRYERPIRILPGAVTITSPDGVNVPVRYTSADETINRSRAIYSSSLEFDAPMGGDYQMVFNTPPAAPTSVIIARPLTDAVEGVLGWFGLGVLGGLIMVAGLVMLIVGVVRRGRAKRAMYAGWPQPQWGAPPQQQWGPPPQQQQWGPPPQQQQWGPPPQQQQWGPPPGAAPGYPAPPPSEPPPTSDPPPQANP